MKNRSGTEGASCTTREEENEITAMGDRVVVLVDMDCFYCQVEEALEPSLKGGPLAVVQHNQWKGGGIIAVNYEARARGVTRHMRGDEARALCPELRLCVVPSLRGKADLSRYREAGARVAATLQAHCTLVERASVDEAYLDLTREAEERAASLTAEEVEACAGETLAAGAGAGAAGWRELVAAAEGRVRGADSEHTRRLLAAAVLVRELRAAVLHNTGFECSAGIAHNKVFAKAVCGLNKPNKQTVLSKHLLAAAPPQLALGSLRGLGGARGSRLRAVLGGDSLADLRAALQAHPALLDGERDGERLRQLARGVAPERVVNKVRADSIGCGKKFSGAAALARAAPALGWLATLADELARRLAEDARRPRRMTVSVSAGSSWSRSCALPAAPLAPDAAAPLAPDAAALLRAARPLLARALPALAPALRSDDDFSLPSPITFLCISVGKFDSENNTTVKKIADFFNCERSQFKKCLNENILSKNFVRVKTTSDMDSKIQDNVMDSNIRDNITMDSNVENNTTTDSSVRDNTATDSNIRDNIMTDLKVPDDRTVALNVPDNSLNDSNVRDNIAMDSTVRGKSTMDSNGQDNITIDSVVLDNIKMDSNVRDNSTKYSNLRDNSAIDWNVRDYNTVGANAGYTEHDHITMETNANHTIEKNSVMQNSIENTSLGQRAPKESRGTRGRGGGGGGGALERYLSLAAEVGARGAACERCGQLVAPARRQTHADYHVARDLSAALNKRRSASPLASHSKKPRTILDFMT